MKAATECDTDLLHLAKPPPDSTIYLELLILPTAQAEPLPVLPRIPIKWAALTKGPHIAVIITSDADGKWTARTSEQDVGVEVKDVWVDKIIFTLFAFARLMFTSSPVSEQDIIRLISQLRS